MTSSSLAEQRAALEAFVIENRELRELERATARFNVFEAMGAVRQELRHSDFLAFLLSPQESHGFGDAFLTRFLQRVLLDGQRDSGVSPVHLDSWDLSSAAVRREWHQIDILVADRRNRLIVAIENKIDSSEHSNQLQRAWAHVTQDEFKGWMALGILLAPSTPAPSEEHHLPASYAQVAQVVEGLLSDVGVRIDPAVQVALDHYVGLLRRHIMSDSEIAELCRLIYQKHRVALDLIFEHRPDLQAEIRPLIERLVGETSGLVRDDSTKSEIRFAAEEWDIPALRQGSGWTTSGRILLFDVSNSASKVDLGLWIGPGPVPIRQHLLDRAIASDAFGVHRTRLNAKWNSIFTRPILSGEELGTAHSAEDLEPLIRERWQERVVPAIARLREALAPLIVQLRSQHTEG